MRCCRRVGCKFARKVAFLRFSSIRSFRIKSFAMEMLNLLSAIIPIDWTSWPPFEGLLFLKQKMAPFRVFNFAKIKSRKSCRGLLYIIVACRLEYTQFSASLLSPFRFLKSVWQFQPIYLGKLEHKKSTEPGRTPVIWGQDKLWKGFVPQHPVFDWRGNFCLREKSFDSNCFHSIYI